MTKEKIINRVRESVPFLMLIALIILFALTTSGRFFTQYNLKMLLIQSSLYIVGGVGATFVMAHGNLDFSLGGIVALSAVIGCTVGMKHPFLTLPVCLAVGVICSMAVGAIHMYAKIPCFVVGFSFMFAGKGFAAAMTSASPRITPASIGQLNTFGFYVAVAVIIVVIGYFILNYTKIGKFNKAIGSNVNAARLSGVPVNKYKFLAFLVTGITIGLTSFVNLVRSGGCTAQTGQSYETQILLALSLGGISLTGGSSVKIRSIVIGAILFMMLDNGLLLMGVDANWIDLIRGIIFILTVFISYDKKSVGFVA